MIFTPFHFRFYICVQIFIAIKRILKIFFLGVRTLNLLREAIWLPMLMTTLNSSCDGREIVQDA